MPENTLPFVEAVPQPNDEAKTAAFVQTPAVVGTRVVHPFTAMRKALLMLTKNEIINSGEHLKRYCAANGLDPETVAKESSIDVMEKAVPEFMFHLTAIAYICVADRKELSEASKTMDKWRDAVFAFWDEVKDTAWQELTVAAFKELTDSEIGNDYKVKTEKGETPQSPN